MRLLPFVALLILFFPSQFKAAELSDASSECLDCHASVRQGWLLVGKVAAMPE